MPNLDKAGADKSAAEPSESDVGGDVIRQTQPTDRVRIFDTSLRDGEQAPGFSMSVAAKLELARALSELGVDVIEAGFAAASPGDEEALRQIAGEIEGARICSLARTHESDIEAAYRALRDNPNRRIHVFIATSPIHRAAKLKMSRDEIVRTVRDCVQHAASRSEDVEFSAEDATRTEPDFLAEVLHEAAQAGARTLNLPDTVGYVTPGEYGGLFAAMRKAMHRDFPDIVLSSHCHNDLGLAVANSLAAVQNGARQVEVAMNGIGERAGNCALEEIVMAIKTRADLFGVHTQIVHAKLVQTARLVAQLTQSPIPRNKAIVGDNAFAHESGIHQHGMLADRRTYEIMQPEDVGFAGSTLVLGKHSGRHAMARRAEAMGITLEDAELFYMCEAMKAWADQQTDQGEGAYAQLADEQLRDMIAMMREGNAGGKYASHGH